MVKQNNSQYVWPIANFTPVYYIYMLILTSEIPEINRYHEPWKRKHKEKAVHASFLHNVKDAQ